MFLFYFSINVFSGTHTRYFVSGLNAYSSAQSGCTAANMTATFNIANCSTTAPGNSSVSQTYTVTWYYSATNASNNTGTGALGSISGGTLQSCGTGSTWTAYLVAQIFPLEQTIVLRVLQLLILLDQQRFLSWDLQH